MNRFKRTTAIILCIVFAAMLASLCVFSCVHCPDCCPSENCHVCLLIHSATGILSGGYVFVCAVITILFAADGCAMFEKLKQRRSHTTLVALKIKLTD